MVVPLHLAPPPNNREHHYARARRARKEIDAVLGALDGFEPPPLPVAVELTRTGWNPLDPDGLVAACKSPIDALARWLGVNDRDQRLFWRLGQKTTRATRMVNKGKTLRKETACALGIVVRSWRTTDGDDPLRVLASVPGGDS